MKIAIHDYFIQSGETALANDLMLGGKELGIDVKRFTCIQEIEDFGPDFVLYLGHQIPKLTQYPTYASMATPTEWILIHYKGILSLDGYLVSPEKKADCFQDICFATTKQPPGYCHIGQSVPNFEEQPADLSKARLVYCGVNWDKRHLELLKLLSKHDWFAVHGPEAAWKNCKLNYRGEIPYEENTLLKKYRSAGIVLAIQGSVHLENNILTNRLLEASAAESVVIAPEMPLIRKYYKDSVLYVDQSATPQMLYSKIVEHVNWVRNNPEEARRMAKKARSVTQEHFSSKKMLETILTYHKDSMKKGGWSLEKDAPQPEVGVIIRAGGRSLKILARCLDSLKNQVYKNIRPVIVLYKPIEGLESFLVDYKALFSTIDVIECWDGIRSTTLWAGLNHVYAQKIPYFGILDDDDEYFPNHISNLVQTLQNKQDGLWAYALSVTEYVDKKFVYGQIKENRAIDYYPFLAKTIHEEIRSLSTCGVLVDTSLLDESLLEDPIMHTAEDNYLWGQLFLKSLPIPSFRCTSLIHREGDNSGFDTHPFRQIDQLKLKTRFLGKRQSNGNLLVTDLNFPKPPLKISKKRWVRLFHILKKLIAKGPSLIKEMLLKIEQE